MEALICGFACRRQISLQGEIAFVYHFNGFNEKREITGMPVFICKDRWADGLWREMLAEVKKTAPSMVYFINDEYDEVPKPLKELYPDTRYCRSPADIPDSSPVRSEFAVKYAAHTEYLRQFWLAAREVENIPGARSLSKNLMVIEQ